MDGREHDRHRALVQPAFVGKALDGLEPMMGSVNGVGFEQQNLDPLNFCGDLSRG
jgi:hypothetical protein